MVDQRLHHIEDEEDVHIPDPDLGQDLSHEADVTIRDLGLGHDLDPDQNLVQGLVQDLVGETPGQDHVQDPTVKVGRVLATATGVSRAKVQSDRRRLLKSIQVMAREIDPGRDPDPGPVADLVSLLTGERAWEKLHITGLVVFFQRLQW